MELHCDVPPLATVVGLHVTATDETDGDGVGVGCGCVAMPCPPQAVIEARIEEARITPTA